ncbi:MAG: 16S rRNA (cytosine(967)-C(5))-methyltransferase RsmB [Pseudomonadota bacterium]
MAKPTDSGAPLRLAAARAVADVVGSGISVDRALQKHLDDWHDRDYSLGAEIVQGSVRWYHLLRAIVRKLAARSNKPPAPLLEALLVCALHQIRHMRIPDHAAVSASVAAVGLSKHRGARGFVNAVLRRYLRERDSIDADLDPDDRYSHPKWLLQAIRDDWGDAANGILTANNERAPMWLRVNRGRLAVLEYVERLRATHPELGVDVTADLPGAVCLDRAIPVETLPGFADGDVSVQDGGAQCAAWVVAPGSGERILDACAAPGNKTAHLAELGDDISLTALDNDATRTESLRTNLARVGVTANVHTVDATDTAAWWDGKAFDRILLDAPCSATGVIRRHPDIKFTRRPADLSPLSALQARLLESLWPTLAPGGTLVYATCSVIRRENERIVQVFVDSHPDAQVRRQLPTAAIQALMMPCGPGFQLLPGRHRFDGFFYACLEKST